jgi:alkanesulfonate monooxygenase SsuD/methylene tetrahydromethanopterin reductase-like flavin-dependent oxidoreductase (luciferase family)
MDISYFTMPVHPLHRNYTETLKEDRESIILADRLGFKDAFVGEHVTDKAENIPNSATFLATFISDTKTIRLGTGTSNLSQSHPALLAGQIAMLDHLLEGRFNFGISPGALPSDAEALGILDKNRNEMFVECINHILALWAGDAPHHLPGKYWTVSTSKTTWPEVGTGYFMKPYQQPHPPIFGTVVAPYSKGIIELGARGWYPISANFLMPKWVKTHWPLFVEGRKKAGLAVSAADWWVAKSVFVCDDDRLARRYAKDDANSPYRFYYSQLSKKLIAGGRGQAFREDPNAPDSSIKVDDVIETLVICGTVESVVDQLLAFRDEVGDFGTLLYAGHDWVDKDLAKRSMELMANKVMPAVNRAIARSRAAE